MNKLNWVIGMGGQGGGDKCLSEDGWTVSWMISERSDYRERKCNADLHGGVYHHTSTPHNKSVQQLNGEQGEAHCAMNTKFDINLIKPHIFYRNLKGRRQQHTTSED